MIYKIYLPYGLDVVLVSDEITFDISDVITFFDINKQVLGVFPKNSGFVLVREDIVKKVGYEDCEYLHKLLSEEREMVKSLKSASLFKRIFQWKF
jgi:hypothetical protein